MSRKNGEPGDERTRDKLDEDLAEGLEEMMENNPSLFDQTEDAYEPKHEETSPSVDDDDDSSDETDEDDDGSDTEISVSVDDDDDSSDETDADDDSDAERIVDDRAVYAETDPFVEIDGYDDVEPSDFVDIDELGPGEWPSKIKTTINRRDDDDSTSGGRYRVYIDHASNRFVAIYDKPDYGEMDGDDTLPGDIERSDEVRMSRIIGEYNLLSWYLSIDGEYIKVDEDDTETGTIKRVQSRIKTGKQDLEKSDTFWARTNHKKNIKKVFAGDPGGYVCNQSIVTEFFKLVADRRILLYLHSIQNDNDPIDLLQHIDAIRQLNTGSDSKYEIELTDWDRMRGASQATIEMDAADFSKMDGTTKPPITAAASDHGLNLDIDWRSWEYMMHHMDGITEVKDIEQTDVDRINRDMVVAELSDKIKPSAQRATFDLNLENSYVSKKDGELVAYVSSRFVAEIADDVGVGLGELGNQLQSADLTVGTAERKQFSGTKRSVWPFRAESLITHVDDIIGFDDSPITESDLADIGIETTDDDEDGTDDGMTNPHGGD